MRSRRSSSGRPRTAGSACRRDTHEAPARHPRAAAVGAARVATANSAETTERSMPGRDQFIRATSNHPVMSNLRDAMARIDAAEPGKSLARWEGLAGLRAADRLQGSACRPDGRRSRRSSPGSRPPLQRSRGTQTQVLSAGNPGEPVVSVSPTGFGWRDGIRPGQLMVALANPSTAPAGSSRPATAGRIEHPRTSGTPGSRDLLPIGLLGLVAGALAVLFLRTRTPLGRTRRRGGAARRSRPAACPGRTLASTLAMGLAAFVPAASLGSRLRSRPRVIAIGILGALAIGWAILRLAGAPERGDDRAAPAARGLLGDGRPGHGAGRRRGHDRAVDRVVRPRVADIAVIVALVLVAVGALALLRVPAIVIAIIVALVLAVVPAARGRFGARSRTRCSATFASRPPRRRRSASVPGSPASSTTSRSRSSSP